MTYILLMHQADAQSWIPQGRGLLPLGYTVLSISAVDDSVIWVTAALESVALSGNPVPLDHKLKVLRSIDGGLSWENHDVATGRFSWDITAEDAQTAWLTTQSYGNGIANALFKTEDGGFTWQNKLIHTAAGVFVRRFDDTHILCQTNKWVAWSSNNGEDWNLDTIQEYLPNEFNTLAAGNNMASVVGDTLWVGTSLGRIVRFTNYGASSEMIYTGNVFYTQSLSFADHLRGMIFHYKISPHEFGLSRTFDGGNTWELTPSKPETNRSYNITYVPGTVATFVAVTEFSQDGSEYYWTTDFGETWTKGGEIENAQTNCVQFLSPTKGWASTGNITQGGEPIVYRWLGDIFTSSAYVRHQLNGFEVSPNPASAKLQYHFDNDDNKMHELTLLDLYGRILRSEKTSSNELDISSLPSGSYFLQIQSEDKAGTRMFVKVEE